MGNSAAATTIDQLALGLGSPATAPQAITQILAAVEPLLTGKWSASLEARAPRMPREDREQVARVKIWTELNRLTHSPGELLRVSSLIAWLCRVAQNEVAQEAGTTSESGISGTNIGRIQAYAAGIRRRLEQAGEAATDSDVVVAYNAGRRAKARAITSADLVVHRTEELTVDLPIRSAIGLMPTAAQLDIETAIQLLPAEQRRAVGLCVMEDWTLEEAAIAIYGDSSQRSRVHRLVMAAKAALAVLLADYAPMPAAA